MVGQLPRRPAGAADAPEIGEICFDRRGHFFVLSGHCSVVAKRGATRKRAFASIVMSTGVSRGAASRKYLSGTRRNTCAARFLRSLCSVEMTRWAAPTSARAGSGQTIGWLPFHNTWFLQNIVSDTVRGPFRGHGNRVAFQVRITAVVSILLWPSSLLITGRVSPSASARDAKLCRK